MRIAVHAGVLGALFAGGAALADQPLVIAVPNPDGTGVTTYSRPGITDTDYAVTTGIMPPPEGAGATVLVLEPGKPARWTNDSVDALDRAYGGDGTPETRDLRDPDQAKPPIARDGATAPIEVFGAPAEAPAVAGAIQPRDGTWKLAQGQTDFTGCPSVRDMIVKLLANRGASDQTRPLTFSHPFKPQEVMFGGDYKVTWTREGPNRWRGVGDVSGMVPAQSFTMDMRFMVTVVSPEAIDVESMVTMTFPPHLAKSMGGDCSGRTPGTLRRVGG